MKMSKKDEQVKEMVPKRKAFYAPLAEMIENRLRLLERFTAELMRLPRISDEDEAKLRQEASVPMDSFNAGQAPPSMVNAERLAALRAEHPIEIENQKKRQANTATRLQLQQTVEAFRRRLMADITNPLAEPTLDRIQRYAPTIEAQAQAMIDVAESLDDAPVVNNPAPRQTTAGNGTPARTQIPGYDKAY